MSAGKLSPEEATRLVMSTDGPPHAEVVARVGPDVAWNAAARRFERVKVAPDLTATELAEAGVAEPVKPKGAGLSPGPASRSSRRRAKG